MIHIIKDVFIANILKTGIIEISYSIYCSVLYFCLCQFSM